ncbi:MAG: HD domain-containing protein [Deltaproteobacteria bacterium]|nr:HD domain-containing protein [Deltaproteobacteria bacterium]
MEKVPLGEIFSPANRAGISGPELKDRLTKAIPELAALRGVQQPPEFHAEGDALTHTLLALESVRADADERVFWAVLLHDLGKAATTEFRDGRWRSHGHEEAGTAMALAVLARLGRDDLAPDVAWLVRHHGFILSWGPMPLEKLSRHQRRFCAHPLFPLLLEVARADVAGARGQSDKGERLAAIERLWRDNSG